MIERLFTEWSSRMEQQWRKFGDDFANYLKYYIFEGETMLELVRKTNAQREDYLQLEKNLALAKQQLFRRQNISEWQLSPDDQRMFGPSELLGKKKLSFPKILHQVFPSISPSGNLRR